MISTQFTILDANGKRFVKKHYNMACFSHMEYGQNKGVVKIGFFPFISAAASYEGLRVYLDVLKKILPLFPKRLTVNSLHEKGFHIRTDNIPGSYAQAMLRCLRPMQERPDQIKAVAGWYNHLSYYTSSLVKTEWIPYLSFFLGQELKMNDMDGYIDSPQPTLVHNVIERPVPEGAAFWMKNVLPKELKKASERNVYSNTGTYRDWLSPEITLLGPSSLKKSFLECEPYRNMQKQSPRAILEVAVPYLTSNKGYEDQQ